jgi:hypothetical protein
LHGLADRAQLIGMNKAIANIARTPAFCSAENSRRENERRIAPVL